MVYLNWTCFRLRCTLSFKIAHPQSPSAQLSALLFLLTELKLLISETFILHGMHILWQVDKTGHDIFRMLMNFMVVHLHHPIKIRFISILIPSTEVVLPHIFIFKCGLNDNLSVSKQHFSNHSFWRFVHFFLKIIFLFLPAWRIPVIQKYKNIS